MADAVHDVAEDPECPICLDKLTGSLVQQPNCGHFCHEKCWQMHLVTYKGNPARCQRCLQHVDQKPLRLLLEELSVLHFGLLADKAGILQDNDYDYLGDMYDFHGRMYEDSDFDEDGSSSSAASQKEALEQLQGLLPTTENRAKVEELLTQLVALGNFSLLNSEAVTRATLTEEGSIRSTAHAVLFAHYMRSLLEESDQFPDTFKRQNRVEQLQLLHSPNQNQIKMLAGLVWDREPEAASRFPCISHILSLETGTAEAHFVTGKLLGQNRNFRNLGRAHHHLLEALRQQHPDAWDALAELHDLGLPTTENRTKVEELLTELVALGNSSLLNSEAVTRATLTEEGSIRSTAHAVLFAHYVLSLLAEADQFPDTFDREKYDGQCHVLRPPRQIMMLAALVWEKEPEAASRFPCISQLLGLERGTAEAHFVLGELLGRRILSGWKVILGDSDKAEHHLREAWRQQHPDAGIALAEVLEQLHKDAEAIQVCKEVLAIDQNHTQANHCVGKLYLKGDNLERAELHLYRASCFWDVPDRTSVRGYRARCQSSEFVCDLAGLLVRVGAREDSLRLALISSVAVRFHFHVKKASSRLRDSLYWEPAMAALRNCQAPAAACDESVLSEVEHYFQRGCHELTENFVRLFLDCHFDDVLVVLGIGWEEQGQLMKAERCYRKAEKDYLTRARMLLLHLRWKLQDPRAPGEISALKLKVARGDHQNLSHFLDVEAESFAKVIPQSIKALWFEDGDAPLQQLTAAQEPISLPDAPRTTPTSSGPAVGAGNPPQQPAMDAPPVFVIPRPAMAASAPPQAPWRLEARGEREQHLVQRPGPAPRGQLLALPPLSLDDEDPDLQTALLRSCFEQQDPLLAVRTNPLLMRAQHLRLQPVSEEPMSEKLFLMYFQQNKEQFKERLHHGSLLAPCRAALEEAGHPWLLEDETGHRGTFVGRFGVKVFVRPDQYQATMELLSEVVNKLLSQKPPKRLYPNHVVVPESLLPLLMESLEGCPGAKLKPNGQVELGEVPLPPVPAESYDPSESLSTDTCDPLLAGLRVVNTFYDTPAALHPGPVTQSDGPAANPRLRKARSSLSSHSEATPPESQHVPHVASLSCPEAQPCLLAPPPAAAGALDHHVTCPERLGQGPQEVATWAPLTLPLPSPAAATERPQVAAVQNIGQGRLVPEAADASPGPQATSLQESGHSPQELNQPARALPPLPLPLPAAAAPQLQVVAVQGIGQGPEVPMETLPRRATTPGQLVPLVQLPAVRSCHHPATVDTAAAIAQPKDTLRPSRATLPGHLVPLVQLPDLRSSATANVISVDTPAAAAMLMASQDQGTKGPATTGIAFGRTSPAAAMQNVTWDKLTTTPAAATVQIATEAQRALPLRLAALHPAAQVACLSDSFQATAIGEQRG